MEWKGAQRARYLAGKSVDAGMRRSSSPVMGRRQSAGIYADEESSRLLNYRAPGQNVASAPGSHSEVSGYSSALPHRWSSQVVHAQRSAGPKCCVAQARSAAKRLRHFKAKRQDSSVASLLQNDDTWRAVVFQQPVSGSAQLPSSSEPPKTVGRKARSGGCVVNRSLLPQWHSLPPARLPAGALPVWLTSPAASRRRTLQILRSFRRSTSSHGATP